MTDDIRFSVNELYSKSYHLSDLAIKLSIPTVTYSNRTFLFSIITPSNVMNSLVLIQGYVL
jgi:hypothetical protein